MSWERYFKVYYGLKGNIKSVVVEAANELDARSKVQKMIPGCKVEGTIKCNRDGSVR